MRNILIGIPAYNEANTIVPLLDAVDSRNVVVVDSASTDDTVSLVRESGHQVLRSTRGKGNAILDLAQYAENAGYEWVITLDADIVIDRSVIDILEDAMSDDTCLVLGNQGQRSGIHPVVDNVYRILLDEIFGFVEPDKTWSLTGYRAFRPELILNRWVPSDFGIETAINIYGYLEASDGDVNVSYVDIGAIDNPRRTKPELPHQIAHTMFRIGHSMSYTERETYLRYVDKIVEILALRPGQLPTEDDVLEQELEDAKIILQRSQHQVSTHQDQRSAYANYLCSWNDPGPN